MRATRHCFVNGSISVRLSQEKKHSSCVLSFTGCDNNNMSCVDRLYRPAPDTCPCGHRLLVVALWWHCSWSTAHTANCNPDAQGTVSMRLQKATWNMPGLYNCRETKPARLVLTTRIPRSRDHSAASRDGAFHRRRQELRQCVPWLTPI